MLNSGIRLSALNMTRLLDLPDELLMAIADFVRGGEDPKTFPFSERALAYEKFLTKRLPVQIQYLHSLYLVSRRFYLLLKPTFYRRIYVCSGCCDECEYPPLRLLENSLADDAAIKEYIVSAVPPCRGSIEEVYRFFWFPNIQELSIRRFDDWDSLGLNDDSKVGTSPVKELSLIGCDTGMEALAAVLSWPAGLEVLHLDSYCGPCLLGTWALTGSSTCAPLTGCLKQQKESLRVLTLTQRTWSSEPDEEPQLDLSDLTALTTLRICRAFLEGDGNPFETWRKLPSNLEELEIHYTVQFLTLHKDDPFLHGLLENRAEHFPKLGTVSTSQDKRREDNQGSVIADDSSAILHMPYSWTLSVLVGLTTVLARAAL